MKTLRRFLRPLLALAVLAASAPSWACVRACDQKAVTLACVELCRQSQAMLSEGGKLATLGSTVCEVSASEGAPATLSAAPELHAPAVLFAVLPAEAPQALPMLRLSRAVLRGPPSFASTLLAETPRANAPPIFC